MSKHLLLMVLFLLLIAGCGPSIKFYPVTGLEDESLSSRPTPAKVTKESEQSLSRKSYIKIGVIAIWDVKKTCWGSDCDSYTCPKGAIEKESMQYNFTEQLMQKSASVGGDLLVLSVDNVVGDYPTSKQGACQEWYSAQEYTTIFTGQTTHTGLHWVKKCRSYETIDGRSCSIGSSGTVWRQESPEHINKIRFTSMKKKYDEARTIALRSINYFSGPLAKKVGDKYGFIEGLNSNKFIIEPQFTSVLYGFSEGLACVAIGTGDKKLWGYIDEAGKFVIRPSYSDADKFNDGLASVRMNNKYGYINKQGIFIIKPQFDKAYRFNEGIAMVKIGNKEGYINKDGEVIMEP
jgi:hypothetical protein